MRSKSFFTAPFVALALAAVTLAGTAYADDTHETVTATKKVTVNAKAGWHVNKEYPWKLIIGDLKLDKSHFDLTETAAVIKDAPSGPAKLKGAICSGDQCRTFEEDVVVP